MEKIQSIKGMRDLLPPETGLWQKLEEEYRYVMTLYNYREIRVPILEKTSLFARSIGEETDIVRKEMYTFTDVGGDELSLRPEGTAGMVRAYIQHSMWTAEPISKLYCIGPMFRHERPQKGRYRQFHQADAEIFGAPEPLADVEQILMLNDYLRRVGLRDVIFVCNHLGTPQSRREYTRSLVSYLGTYKQDLCEDCLRRVETNPLRVLDCKQPGCIRIVAEGPSIEGFRPPQAAESFAKFLGLLERSSIEVKVDPRLVRGLDYYTGIVFEAVVWGRGQTSGEGGRQSKEAKDNLEAVGLKKEEPMELKVSIAGGGRYDGLVEQLGGPPTPAVGFAIGLERVAEVCSPAPDGRAVVFVAFLGARAELLALKLMQDLRREGISCDFDPRGGSLKSQLRRADRVSARIALIVGEKEIESGRATVRDMQSGSQEEVRFDDLVRFVCAALEKQEGVGHGKG